VVLRVHPSHRGEVLLHRVLHRVLVMCGIAPAAAAAGGSGVMLPPGVEVVEVKARMVPCGDTPRASAAVLVKLVACEREAAAMR